MKWTVGTVIIISAAMAASGCLHMENTHRLYLSPRGELSWTVQQSDVRSDAERADARQDEEQRFLGEVESGSHPVALAFHALGARRVDWQVPRRVRPMAVLTTAEFGPAHEAVTNIIRQLSLDGRATLTRAGTRTTLTITLQTLDGDQAYEGPLTALFEDLPQYRIVLTEGRLVDAEGFTISADGAVATPLDAAGSIEPGRSLRLSLTWIE